MTKSICCIGTSHLGCLKSGWDEVEADYPEIRMTFFGAPNTGMAELIAAVALSNGSIIPQSASLERYFEFTSGGSKEIKIGNYDAFVIIGCGIGLTPILDIYEAHRSHRMHLNGQQLISEDCFIDVASDIFLNSTASKFARAIRSASKAPVFLVPDPRPSVAVIDKKGSPNPIWDHYIKLINKLHRSGDGEVISEIFRKAMGPIATTGTSVLDASGSLVTEHIFTPHELCRDSVWLQNGKYEGSPEMDYFHMNAIFGAKILATVIAN